MIFFVKCPICKSRRVIKKRTTQPIKNMRKYKIYWCLNCGEEFVK